MITFLPLSILLLIVDYMLLLSSSFSMHFVFGKAWFDLGFYRFMALHSESFIFPIIMIYVFYLNELYEYLKPPLVFRNIVRSYLFAVTPVLVLIFILSTHGVLERKIFLATYIISFLLILLWRTAAASLFEKFRPIGRALIVGTGSAALDASDLLNNGGERPYEIVGYFPVDGNQILVPPEKILPAEDTVCAYVAQHPVDKVIVALDDRRGSLPLSELLECKMAGVDVMDVPTLMEAFRNKISLNIHSSAIVFASGFKRSRTDRIIKNTLDRIFALLCLIVSAPFFILIPLLIRLTSKGPVLFRQVRVGLHGKAFKLLKFRTMREDAEANGPVWAGENDPRITRLGSFLRKTRLDELPQLFNVLEGSMSFVGPRPERPEFVNRLKDTIPYYTQRHAVKPGITGWAQIKYKYGASVQDSAEKLQYDLYYIKHFSLFLDIYIVFETIRSVLVGRGAR